jgi:hypothetical protein
VVTVSVEDAQPERTIATRLRRVRAINLFFICP